MILTLTWKSNNILQNNFHYQDAADSHCEQEQRLGRCGRCSVMQMQSLVS